MFVIGFVVGMFVAFVPLAIYLDIKRAEIDCLRWQNQKYWEQIGYQSELFEAGYGERVWPESEKERVRD